ncbi:hypothetical protein F5887DRAFT_1285955 [Amanita rubescens]|nr:hypothetical protein F5887DRAFT_1285955 [Amanita rubescens]
MASVPPPNTAGVVAAPPQWLAHIIGDINQMQEEMQTRFALIEARQVNARISRLNKLDMNSNPGQIAFRAKQKEVAGDGTALANNLLVAGEVGPFEALQPVPAVGTTVGDTINLIDLTHHGILRLVQYYNTDFGIQPGELAVAVRQQRILYWLTNDV